MKCFGTNSLFLLIAMLISCEAESEQMDDVGGGLRYFQFTVITESVQDTFVVRSNDAKLLAQLDSLLNLPKDQRSLHVNGRIAEGNNGYNRDWSWHFVDGEWVLAEMSIELCDGTPSYVEQNLQYFINNINGQFCPWGSVLDSEITLE